VLGMHRSGTSAITRVVSLLGYALPKSLLGANEGNQAGHWESTEIIALNDEILESAGTRWDDWTPFNPSWYDTPLAAAYLTRARELIRSEFADAPMFVLKDPRICRFAPLWLNALDAENIDTRVVSPIRHPVEVSGSLHRRDMVRMEYGKLLWLRYVLDAEHASRGRKRFFYTFDELLTDWPSVLARMSEKLEWPWTRTSAAVNQTIDEFLSPRYRTQVLAAVGTREHDSWTRSTYEVLEKWSKAGPDAAGEAMLDEIKASFDKAAPTFADLLLPARDSRAQAQGAVPADDQELPRVREELEGEREARGELHNAMEALRVAQEAANTQWAAERDGLAGRAAEAEAQSAQLREQLAERAEREQRTREELESERQARGELHEAMEALRLAQETANAQWAAERDGLAGRAAEAEAQSARLGEQLADRAEREQRTREELESERQARGELLAAVEGLRLAQEELRRQQELRNQQLESEADSRRQEVAELESNLRQRQEENAQAWAELEREKQARGKLEARVRELQDMEQRVESLSRSLHHANARAERVTLALRAQKRAAEALKAELAEKERALAAAEEQLTMSKRAAALLQAEGEEALERLAALENERSELKADVDTARQSLDERFSELATLGQILVDEESQRKRLENQSSWLRQVNDVLMRRGKWWWPLMSPAWQRQRRLRWLALDGLFDAEAYVRAYPDVATSGQDPLRHYIAHGLDEHRPF